MVLNYFKRYHFFAEVREGSHEKGAKVMKFNLRRSKTFFVPLKSLYLF